MKPFAYRRPGAVLGFTLIELLVVIAIIAILAAILFPVFAKAREKARQIACLSNEKQISLGLLQYTQDYDEYVPYMFYGSNGAASDPATGKYKWMDAIYPYVKSEAIFSCPDATYPYTDSASENFYGYRYYQSQASSDTSKTYYYGSYGYNAMYRNDSNTLGRTPPCGQNSVPQSSAGFVVPATTVWIVDGVNYVAGWNGIGLQPSPIINTAASPLAFNTQSGGTKNDLVVGRHIDRTNVIYCDGHVKAVTLNSLATDTSTGSDGKTTLRDFTIQDD